MAKPVSKKDKLEFEPDAWQRFERAMAVVAKSPPQHRTKANPKARKSPVKQKPKRKK